MTAEGSSFPTTPKKKATRFRMAFLSVEAAGSTYQIRTRSSGFT